MNPSDLKFLVVDDSDVRRRVIPALLKEMGCTKCEVAETGQTALDKLREPNAKFGFVITDIQMPEMDGFQLLEAIKADASLRHLPVLMVTTTLPPEHLRQAGEKGASGCIVQPFTKDSLKDRITRILQRLPAR